MRADKVALLVAIALAGAGWAIRRGLRFDGPHRVARSAAVVDAQLRSEIDGAPLPSPDLDGALATSLDLAGRHLRFGLRHPTSLSFRAGVREGNCIEYAHLAAFAFDALAKRAGIPARAFVVHSEHASIAGIPLPLAGFASHDWVLVTSRRGRKMADPTLADAFLGADLAGNVAGELPRVAKDGSFL